MAFCSAIVFSTVLMSGLSQECHNQQNCNTQDPNEDESLLLQMSARQFQQRSVHYESASPVHQATASWDFRLGPMAETIAEAKGLCEGVMGRAPVSIADAMFSDSANVCEQPSYQLSQADFDKGTYIIKRPGIYTVTEDIVFAPVTEYMLPAKDSAIYRPNKGYWLGFFAAIAVACENVFLNLNGKTISMSYEFLMRQRFFSIIQLGERPFRSGTGPPQFSVLQGEIAVAKNLVISNGILGMSSHMGVHGVDNENIWVQSVVIKDFETGGIQLNGARNVHITDMHVGPSLGVGSSAGVVPGLATLSQAHLLLRIVEAEQHEAEEAFVNLKNSVESYITQILSKLSDYFGPDRADRSKKDIAKSERIFWNKKGVPEGSSMYGVLFHSSKPAIHEFGACADAQADHEDGASFGPLNLTNVKVHKLKLRTDEVVSMNVVSMNLADPPPVMGPAGDKFQFFRVKDELDNYVPNVLSEAQLALGRLKAVWREENSGEYSEDEFEGRSFQRFGATNIPPEVLAWADGDTSFSEMTGALQAQWVCNKDAMGHHNKGVVGVRIEYYNDVMLDNVKSKRLRNTGSQSEVSHCTPDDATYGGNDARGFSMSHVSNLVAPKLVSKDINSNNGRAYGVEERTDVEYHSDFTPYIKIKDISGALGSEHHVRGVDGMLDTQ